MQRDLDIREELRELDWRNRLPERSPLGRIEPTREPDRVRSVVRDRGRMHWNRQSEAILLRHVGAFRSVRIEDLERFAYSGQAIRFGDDMRRLMDRRLAVELTEVDPLSGNRVRIATLTKAGASIAQRWGADSRQAIHSGIASARQLSHDLDVYRMYHAEVARIEQGGGRARRVVLECELTGQFHRALQDESRSSSSVSSGAVLESHAAAVREWSARRLGLNVISGTVQVPDLRIEYENALGELARVDLELATAAYGGSVLAAKMQAGFKIYAAAADVDRVHGAVVNRDMFVEVLSL